MDGWVWNPVDTVSLSLEVRCGPQVEASGLRELVFDQIGILQLGASKTGVSDLVE